MKEDGNRERIITTKGKLPNEWILNINGNEHIIYYHINKIGEDGKLYIDGELYEIQKKSKFLFVCFDQRITLDGRIIHCVFDGAKFDVAVHGKYVKSKKDYVPIKKLLINILIAVLLIVVEFILIGINAPALPSIIIIFSVLIINALHSDYLIKKAKEE